MDLQRLIPSLGHDGLMRLFAGGQWHVDHGSLERFPAFLRPGDGALSSIAKLGAWRHFDIGYRDSTGKYNQLNGAGHSAAAYYDMGALVRSTSIDEATPEARPWLDDWAQTLGVLRSELRFNSWAVRGANGIDWHFDPEDVIHFQIKGDKLLKFLPSEDTIAADTHTKRAERFLKPGQNFANADEAIVRPGTITVIPRGVWHWSEGQSDESFAVALCVNPSSYAWSITQSLYRRLRLLESQRRPTLGHERIDSMTACLKEASIMLEEMSARSVLAEERKIEFPLEHIDSLYFQATPMARAEFAPLRMSIGDRPLGISGDETHLAILNSICRRGSGFWVRDLTQHVPRADKSRVGEVLLSLVRAGFLDFIAAKN